jgi:hypothetical protein
MCVLQRKVSPSQRKTSPPLSLYFTAFCAEFCGGGHAIWRAGACGIGRWTAWSPQRAGMGAGRLVLGRPVMQCQALVTLTILGG